MRLIHFLCVISFTFCACTDTKTPIENPNKNGSQVDLGGQDRSLTLRLSEIVAKSDDETFLDGNDWIEIHNAGLVEVNLANYSLADSSGFRVVLPELLLASGAYFVIAAVDSETVNTPWPSVPFKLGGEDSVFLFFGESLIDSILWTDGDARKGTSFGYLGSTIKTLLPTPEAVNVELDRAEPSTNTVLLLTEIVAKSSNDQYLEGNDWIEIYNSGAAVVSLNNYFLADSKNELFPLSGQIEPGEYWVVAAVDAENESPPLPFVPFKLGAEDSVRLYLGNELVRELSWFDGDAGSGWSFGLVDDVAQTTIPTPGQANRL